MVEIIPHIDTLIVDIGSKFTKIGYSGDFHPTYTFKTSSFSPFQATSYETACKILEKYLKECSVDSLILIESPDFGFEDSSKILKFLFVNKLCQSVLLLKSPIADIFGFGKVSGTVLCCSASSFRVSTVINGRIVESHVLAGGSARLESAISKLLADSGENRGIVQDILQCEVFNDPAITVSSILESRESIENLKARCGVDIFEILRPDIAAMVDKVVSTRSSYYINKKNSANGCIILSGGLFRFDSFHNFVKSLILDRIGADFADFVLRDRNLNCTFVGASVFGMNNQTKTMFMTYYDWQNVGADILKVKTL
ncbi:uncharacterized protein VICG_00918 [Vittaforma corneae ATCC 50505]|uniref:Actin-like protein N-terminal domain-containing protein n=1 Tax=Vittaforma corneae (strain ATCC 50505) TaxID=993615 RepID=L2GN80_VITCO|nr:uncharacterized protein VICG_00918 [Vittaforma corneae ATCC 50505]ELA42069.1 hypothetical protein VICG_00918 [Vittaforma corneae ATCC 50505]